MFDMKKLEHWLDGFQTEAHFPNGVPQKVVKLPKSSLDEKMDRYDISLQRNFDHNYGTAEFPVYGPVRDDLFANMTFLPYTTYGSLSPFSPFSFTNMYSMGGATSFPMDSVDAPPVPQETSYDRFKSKLTRLASAPVVKIANPAPPVPSRSPDFVHTLTAWRGWEVRTGELEALGYDSRWESRRAPKAQCRGGKGHDAPYLDCHCGYWSFKTLDLLTQALENYASSVDVIGQVEIWGRVIECKNGWRSEFAYPKELWLLADGLDELSWKYGVPVRRLG